MKTFELRTLLTVTTGRLLTKGNGPRDNGIGHLYEILGWMTNDDPMTHQLGRFSEECKPWLLRWFPELAEADKHLVELDRAIECVKAANRPLEHAIDNWLQLCVVDWGMKAVYEVDRIPADDHDAVRSCCSETLEKHLRHRKTGNERSTEQSETDATE